jgi:2-polyprenyl-3-methyl-5-hydroxy-6-metoxy-1,4-benzoquinol methylase
MSYAKTYYLERSSGGRADSKVEWFVANYAHLLPADKQARICEIGPGMGHILSFLVNDAQYPRSVGLEIDRDLWRIANEKAPGHCLHVESVARHFQASTDALDLVIMMHVLEHLEPEPALELLRSIRARLEPGGVLIVEVPNAAHPLTGAATFHADFTHRKGYTNTSLDQVLAMAGFETRHTGAVRAPGGGVSRWAQAALQRLLDGAITLAMRVYFPSDPPVVSVAIYGIARKA